MAIDLPARAAGRIARSIRQKTGLGLPGRRAVFIHIPKTGGRSIGRMMKSAYWGQPILWIPSGGVRRERVLGMPQEKLDRYAGYRGHVTASFADRVTNPFVFTFLREPRDRTISQYFYNRSLDSAERQSLGKFLESAHADNVMTRSLVGEPSAEAAIDALSRMDFVGIMERFEEDTRRLFELLGRPPVEPVKWKPTLARVELEDLAPRVRAALEERTAADRKVYDWVLQQG